MRKLLLLIKWRIYSYRFIVDTYKIREINLEFVDKRRQKWLATKHYVTSRMISSCLNRNGKISMWKEFDKSYDYHWKAVVEETKKRYDFRHRIRNAWHLQLIDKWVRIVVGRLHRFRATNSNWIFCGFFVWAKVGFGE